VGNLGKLCDLEILLAAASSDSLRGRIHLVIVGRGDKKEWLKSRLGELQISFEMHEPIYSNVGLSAILSGCNIGFNGYVNTTASFSYKAIMYLAAGLPIVNSMGGDLKKLVECQGIGVNFRSQDVGSLIGGLAKLDAATLLQLSKNSEQFFDKELEASVVDNKLRSILLREYNLASGCGQRLSTAGF
jgi:glycosyltransferase involved in cell wall biosynthesis